MRGLLISAMGIAIVISGCATRQKMDDFEIWSRTVPEANADYGSYPTEYKALIKGYLFSTLKDPEAAKISEISVPRKEYAIKKSGIVVAGNLPTRQAIYGYSACVVVNGKNTFGAYAGNHLFWFFIQKGQIVDAIDTTANPYGREIYRGHPINCQNG